MAVGRALGLGALVVAAAVLAAPAQARLEASSAVGITDPTGDSGAAPDLRQVDVGNDVVRGHLVIWLETPNRQSLSGADVLALLLDTDLSPDTGASGFDFLVAADASGTGALFRWDGADFVQVPAPTLVWSPGGIWARVEIHPSDLGDTRAINYVAVASAGEELDFVPDVGAGSYSLSAGPLVLTADAFAVAPKAARAGRAFTAKLRVWRQDTAESLAEGTVTCTAMLAGKRVPARRGRERGAATCRLTLPKSAKGKLLVVTVKVTYAGKSVARTYRGKVR